MILSGDGREERLENGLESFGFDFGQFIVKYGSADMMSACALFEGCVRSQVCVGTDFS